MVQKFNNRPREEAIEKIEFYIAQNKMNPHDKLPSERDMCAMWGFNRMTLRSAIQHMIQEGKIYNRKGSGTFVAEPKLERNLQDLQSFSEIASDAGRKAKTVVIDTRVIESSKQIAQSLCLMLGHRVLQLIRIRMIDDEPIMIETTYVDYEKYQGIDKLDFGTESLYSVMTQNYGIEIASGTERISITFATSEEAELLKVEKGTPLFFLSGVVKDEKGIPIEYFKTVARPDKIRFSSILVR